MLGVSMIIICFYCMNMIEESQTLGGVWFTKEMYTVPVCAIWLKPPFALFLSEIKDKTEECQPVGLFWLKHFARTRLLKQMQNNAIQVLRGFNLDDPNSSVSFFVPAKF